MPIKVPFREMIKWKTGNIAPTAVGFACVIATLLSGKNISLYQSTLQFGLTFIAVAIIMAKSSPTVFGSLFTMALGISYFFTYFTNIADAILWAVTLALFVGVVIFEFGIFKLGPSNSKAKVLIAVPLSIVAFALLFGLVGYGTYTFNWNTRLYLSLGYFAIMLFSWLKVFEIGGYKPFKGKTYLWLNILGLAGAFLIFLSIYQQGLLPW
jgi:hypothetical protein